MHYDPVKDIAFNLVRKIPGIRLLFFSVLDMLLLRQWYVKKNIKTLYRKSKGFRFYDAGAGFCQYSDFVLSHWSSSTVLALDLKRDYVTEYAKYAEHKYNQRFEYVIGDLVDYVPEKKFDLIAAIDILEHIENDVQVLRNFYTCLCDEGKLIISTPSDKDEAAKFTSEHVRPGYDVNDLMSKLINVGFKIKTTQLSYGKWGKVSWLIGIKFPLSMLTYSKITFLLMPLYYLCLYPIMYLLMLIDISVINKSGNGIVVVAEKNVSAS